MAPQEKINYFKLVALIADIACLVIWKYIRENILGKYSFETFLNKEKHKLVHLYETLPCCECMVSKINGERLVSRKQFLVLYRSVERNKISCHNKYVCKKLTQICICNYSANENVDVKVVDITLANYIIQKCGKREQGVDNWIEQIKDVRNKIFHLSDIQKITDDKFNRTWTKLEGSILGIANLMDSAYVAEIEKKILQTKEHVFISSCMLKYEKLCCEYWRNKCAEFERAQVQVIEKKARALHMKDPKVFSKSMEKDCHKTMEEIQKFKTIVDNIDILIKVFGKSEDVNTLLVNEDIQRVPVFLQLDLPASWNRTKVLEYLDEMRINGTSDMNIKIMAVSPDDLNIYSEIAKTVLNKVDLLKDEVQKLLSGMLLEAAIDPKQSAEVGFSLTIPKITEETSEINSEDEHDEAEQADHPSAIDDCQTRTEFDESVRFKSYFQFDISRRQKLQLEPIQNSLISDCVITNNQLVFTDYFNNILHIYNINGSHNRDIRLSNHPKCISVIKDTDVAVSYNRDIDIIDINTGEVKNTIVTRGVTSGISYQNGLMYVVICHQKIDVMKMTGEIVRSIHCPFQSLYISLSTDTDSLLLTDPLTLTLYCCDLYGSVKWKFTSDKMQMPTGVTTDVNGNVYVVCNESNNVIVVSADGNHHKELLTEKDRLQKPTGIYYNKSNDCLLVCNGGNCDAFLFDIKHLAKN